MLRNDLGTPLPDTYMPDMVVAVEEKRVQSRRRVLKSEKSLCARHLFARLHYPEHLREGRNASNRQLRSRPR